uniref:Uncharacterized protein n=1 Tax=Anopheles epiroticus TaxID=199890 RepID=A0A182PXD1_9DIPT
MMVMVSMPVHILHSLHRIRRSLLHSHLRSLRHSLHKDSLRSHRHSR